MSLDVRNELEKKELGANKSKASKRGIFSLRKWCVINGYPGVTKECIASAKQSSDPKIIKMTKQALLNQIAEKGSND